MRRSFFGNENIGALVFSFRCEDLFVVVGVSFIHFRSVRVVAADSGHGGVEWSLPKRLRETVGKATAEMGASCCSIRKTSDSTLMRRVSDHNRCGRLPDFIIVGATKAGTTSLDFYLSLHHEIHMARPKESLFFIDAPEPLGRWRNGIDWYRGLFRSEKRICGEASPAYTHAPALPGVPERMSRIVRRLS